MGDRDREMRENDGIVQEPDLPSQRQRCARQDNILTPCVTLESMLEGPYLSRRKGLTSVNVVNLKTHKTTKTFVALRSGVHRRKGLVLNYCPFCGRAVRDLSRDDDDSNLGGQSE